MAESARRSQELLAETWGVGRDSHRIWVRGCSCFSGLRQAIRLHFCGIGSESGRRPSLADSVRGPATTREAPQRAAAAR